MIKTLSATNAMAEQPIFRIEFEDGKTFLVLGTERLSKAETAEVVAKFNGEIPKEHQALSSGALKGFR